MGFYTNYLTSCFTDEDILLKKKSFNMISNVLMKAGIPKKIAYNPVFLDLLYEEFEDIFLAFECFVERANETNMDVQHKKQFFEEYISYFKNIFEITKENNKLNVSMQCLHRIPIRLSADSEIVSKETFYTLPSAFGSELYNLPVGSIGEKYFLPSKKETLLYIKEFFEKYNYGYTIENNYEGKDFIYNIDENTYSLKKVEHAFEITNEECSNKVIIRSTVRKTIETYNQDNKMIKDATYNYFGETDLNGFKLDEAVLLEEKEVTELDEDKRYVNYKKTTDDGFEFTIDKLNVSYSNMTETDVALICEIKRFDEKLWETIGQSVRETEAEFCAKKYFKKL